MSEFLEPLCRTGWSTPYSTRSTTRIEGTTYIAQSALLSTLLTKGIYTVHGKHDLIRSSFDATYVLTVVLPS